MVDCIVAIEVSRGQNIGTIIRCVVAFGAKHLIIVGSTKFCTYGAHGSQAHIHIMQFFSWNAAADYVKSLESYEICGISPTQPSTSSQSYVSTHDSLSNINSKMFAKSVLFVLPKSSSCQFTSQQLVICDSFVYVPIPSLTHDKHVKMESKLSICLYKFASLFPGRFVENSYVGEKYDLGAVRHGLKVECMETIASTNTELEEDVDVGDGIMSLFSSDQHDY